MLAATLVSGAAVLGLLIEPAAGGAYATGLQPPANPIFKSILPALKRAGVPVYLPTIFPEKGHSHLYASLLEAKPGYYSFTIDFTADCRGADACNYAYLQGERAPTGRHEAIRGSRVVLGGNITGYFLLGTCGASCAESSITWVSASHEYEIWAQLSRKDLIAFTSSAVAAGPYQA
jgi:hypothetical protein